MHWNKDHRSSDVCLNCIPERTVSKRILFYILMLKHQIILPGFFFFLEHFLLQLVRLLLQSPRGRMGYFSGCVCSSVCISEQLGNWFSGPGSLVRPGNGTWNGTCVRVKLGPWRLLARGTPAMAAPRSTGLSDPFSWFQDCIPSTTRSYHPPLCPFPAETSTEGSKYVNKEIKNALKEVKQRPT